VSKEPQTKPTFGLVYDPVYKTHRPGPGHPEAPERCDACLAGIRAEVPDRDLLKLPVRAATDDEVTLCHSRAYLDVVRRDVEGGFSELSTGDTNVSEQSLTAAYMAAGGVLAAVDAVVNGEVKSAFCVVRPPGHHATADRGMGFCIFNNVAIGARYAQTRHGLQRVLIVDWDIHHGNGTQEMFYGDPSVFYFSTHQWPFYPGTGAAGETGEGEGRGFTINCPFPLGTGGQDILGMFRDRLVPAMVEFRPELVLVSAGFDARRNDPIGNFLLSDQDFSHLTEVLMAVADDYADGRLVSVLEGGYDLDGLASAAGAHVRRLAEG